MKSLKILSALSMFAAAYSGNAYHKKAKQEVPEDDRNRKRIYETRK